LFVRAFSASICHLLGRKRPHSYSSCYSTNGSCLKKRNEISPPRNNNGPPRELAPSSPNAPPASPGSNIYGEDEQAPPPSFSTPRNASRAPLSSPASRATSSAVLPSESRVARSSRTAAAAAVGSLARPAMASNTARAAEARPCCAAQCRHVQPSWSCRSTWASRSSTNALMSPSPTCEAHGGGQQQHEEPSHKMQKKKVGKQRRLRCFVGLLDNRRARTNH